jgi:hypothetical protein
MPKISELNPITSVSLDDLVPVVNDPNGAPSTNKITFENFANSVVNYFDAKGIFDDIYSVAYSAANTGNVSFSHTTITTRNAGQDLTLSPQGSNVYIGEGKNLVVSNIINENDISISANNDLVWNFSTEGALFLNSSEYNEIIGFGYGMGPTIASESSLYTVSYYANTETDEYWEQGSLSYPESYQIVTQYSNSEPSSTRSTEIYLHSDIAEHVIGLGIVRGNSINNRYWEFDRDGNINLPDGGLISDSLPIHKFGPFEAYDQITWDETSIIFSNVFSAELRNILDVLQAGDRISLDDTDTTVVTPYTGGTDGTIEVNGNYSIPDVQLFELPDRRGLIKGIRLKTSSANTWTFGVDGVLTLPNDGDIANSTGGSVLTTIANFGEGFSLTASNKIVTNKLYSTNLSSPSQHYRLTLDTNGVVHLPDESIINGAYIRTVPGNYAGLAAGPNSEHSEDSWMWVDNGGSWIATDYSNHAFTWQFDNNGDLILPRSSIISETDNTLVLTPPNALAGQSLVIRPTVGSFSLSTDHPDGFVPGASITITTNNIIGNGAGTLNYEFSGATSVQLGRATTGILTFESSDTTKDLTWTIPSLSSMTTFTFTLTGGTGFGGINGLPISITVTLDGSAVTENNHIHLTSDNNITTDLYLGDDDQYVKIEKNSGGVVIGTNTNTKQWTFGTDGTLSLPVNAEIGSESPFNITNAKIITANTIVVHNNVYDDLLRPLLNPNALDINADGGTSISIFAVRDEAFTGGGSQTIYSQYEAALDGGFSYNNRHASSFIDGGGSNQI